jgi:2-polyprenyl-6-methoxyphenol hydroxylase-like FAD-dependent oxidoreductase
MPAVDAADRSWYSENGGIIVMETLTSSSPMATYSPTLNSRITEISPAKRVFVTHHMLLRILRRRVKNLALIRVKYECTILEVIQDKAKVIAKFKDGQITAKYCIGCDGFSGVTRKIVTKDNVTGHGILTNSLTIVFRVIPLPPPLCCHLTCITMLHILTVLLGGLETISEIIHQFPNLHLQSKYPRFRSI